MSVKIEGLEFSVGELIFRAQFEIKKGEVCGLLAPSGFGKSSLILALAGILPVQAGKIILNKKEIQNEAVSKREIGIVFQKTYFVPERSVIENATLGKKVNSEYFKKCVEGLKLTKHLSKKILELSGGEKSRLAILRALLLQREFLILDEPLHAIDEQTKTDIINFLKEEFINKSALFITHSLHEAQMLGAKMIETRSKKQGTQELREFYVP